MKLDPNDPRLTAYVLGELDDEASAAIGEALAENPHARSAADETAEVARQLTEALRQEDAPRLADAQRLTIVAEARGRAGAGEAPDALAFPKHRLLRLTPRRAAALAAVLIVGIGLTRVYQARHFLLYGSWAWFASHRDAFPGDEVARDTIDAPTLRQLARALVTGQDETADTTGTTDRVRLRPIASADTAQRGPSVPAAPGAPAAVIAAQPPSDGGSAAAGAPSASVSASVAEAPPAAAPLPGMDDVGARGGYSWAPVTPAPGMPVPLPPAGWPSDMPGNGAPYTGGESYRAVIDNPFQLVAEDRLSTFAIDVDTASYANVRRYLEQLGQLPPPDAVRIEEMVNYFDYDDPPPTDGEPFAVHAEVAEAPWHDGHRLVRIGVRGRDVPASERPDVNLVFLLDVSGSMDEPNKLPLVKQAMQMLVGELGPRDRVAIVTYAGWAGVALPSTPASRKAEILSAIGMLSAGGSTAGAAGIETAYAIAAENFLAEGTNRVILCTDGDFNVGITNPDQLGSMIAEKARSGVYLTVLGFGMGNYKDATLEQLADRGNGNYGYVDTPNEGRKLLVEQLSATLVTIAKDVKVQVEFNPATVSAYRLIGYENRQLADRDFDNDAVDAGEIGAGHTVTALYEVVPVGAAGGAAGAGSLRYGAPASRADVAYEGELMTIRLRYKPPQGLSAASRLIEVPVRDSYRSVAEASPDLQFSAAVAAFGMLLRDSPYRGSASFDMALSLAESGRGLDRSGYRAEFAHLVRLAAQIRAGG